MADKPMYLIEVFNAKGDRGFLSEKDKKCYVTDKVIADTKLFHTQKEAIIFASKRMELSRFKIRNTQESDLPGLKSLTEPIYLIKVLDMNGYAKGYIHYNTNEDFYYEYPGKVGACCWKIEDVQSMVEKLKKEAPQAQFIAVELVPK